jgi:hypothetical protein
MARPYAPFTQRATQEATGPAEEPAAECRQSAAAESERDDAIKDQFADSQATAPLPPITPASEAEVREQAVKHALSLSALIGTPITISSPRGLNVRVDASKEATCANVAGEHAAAAFEAHTAEPASKLETSTQPTSVSRSV